MWPIGVASIIAWEAFAAFGGAFFAFVIGFTRHWIVAWNENLLQFTPIGLVVIASLLVRRWRRVGGRAATVAAGLSVLGATVALSHLTSQQTAPAVALALPMHVATWSALRSRARRRSPEPSPKGTS